METTNHQVFAIGNDKIAHRSGLRLIRPDGFALSIIWGPAAYADLVQENGHNYHTVECAIFDENGLIDAKDFVVSAERIGDGSTSTVFPRCDTTKALALAFGPFMQGESIATIITALDAL